MTAQLWKRSGEPTARVTFRCPWCDVVGTAMTCGCHQAPAAAWLLIGCPEPTCQRGVMISVSTAAAGTWIELDTGDTGILLDRSRVYPLRFASAPLPPREEIDRLLARAEALLDQLRAAMTRLAAASPVSRGPDP